MISNDTSVRSSFSCSMASSKLAALARQIAGEQHAGLEDPPIGNAVAVVVDVFPEGHRILALGLVAEPQALVLGQAGGGEGAGPQALGPGVTIGATARIGAVPGDEDGDVVDALALAVVGHGLEHDVVVGVEPVHEAAAAQVDQALGGDLQGVACRAERRSSPRRRQARVSSQTVRPRVTLRIAGRAEAGAASLRPKSLLNMNDPMRNSRHMYDARPL
jgi:hypothetical protein